MNEKLVILIKESIDYELEQKHRAIWAQASASARALWWLVNGMAKNWHREGREWDPIMPLGMWWRDISRVQ